MVEGKGFEPSTADQPPLETGALPNRGIHARTRCHSNPAGKSSRSLAHVQRTPETASVSSLLRIRFHVLALNAPCCSALPEIGPPARNCTWTSTFARSRDGSFTTGRNKRDMVFRRAPRLIALLSSPTKRLPLRTPAPAGRHRAFA